MDNVYVIDKVVVHGDCVKIWFFDYERGPHVHSEKEGGWHLWFKTKEFLRHINKDEFENKMLSRIFEKGIKGVKMELNQISEIKKITI